MLMCKPLNLNIPSLLQVNRKFILFFAELLRQKDREQAHLMEEKMALQLKLLAAAGVDNVPERPNYMHLVSEQLDNTKVWKDVNTAVKASITLTC